MKLIILAAALATLPSAVSASPAITVIGNTAHVAYRDLDLHSTGGRLRLSDRIRFAASLLCGDDQIESLTVGSKQTSCYRHALASGLSQMNEVTSR